MLRAALGLAPVLLIGCVQAFGLDNPELTGDESPPPGSGSCAGAISTTSCFERHEGPATWSAARDTCASSGGTLAKTGTQVAMTAVANLVRLDEAAWLGASNGVDLDYEWLDGTAVAYSGWLPFNPDDSTGQCMTFANRAALGWENWSCGEKLAFICERPL